MSAKPPSKTQVLNTIAEQTGLKKQDVVSVLDSLGSQISSALNSEAGAFTTVSYTHLTLPTKG